MPGKQSAQPSAFKKFISKNRSLVFMLPLLVVLVIVLIVVYSGMDDKPVSSSSSTPALSQSALPSSMENQTQVEVLPNLERAADEQREDIASVQDPFKAPMKLTGVLLYSDERAKAIIEYGGVIYIVRKDEAIGDTPWIVVKISKDSVMLASDDRNLLLELNDNGS